MSSSKHIRHQTQSLYFFVISLHILDALLFAKLNKVLFLSIFQNSTSRGIGSLKKVNPRCFSMSHLVQFVKCWWIFLELHTKGLYLGLKKEIKNRCLLFAPPTEREIIRKFHVVVAQRRQRNVQKAWCTCKTVVLLI